jgi:hypothetical protein
MAGVFILLRGLVVLSRGFRFMSRVLIGFRLWCRLLMLRRMLMFRRMLRSRGHGHYRCGNGGQQRTHKFHL